MDERFVKGSPMPPALGEKADLYAMVRALRLDMEKAAREVHDRETEIYNAMLGELTESTGNTGASGATHRVQLVQKPTLPVKDWAALHAYIQANGAFELLQKRLSTTAAQEIIDSGETLPGVEPSTYFALSITKR